MADALQYNFTIDDTSPILQYSPYADFASAGGKGDGLRNGWQSWYTGSGYLSDAGGPSPVGESFHLTSLSGASISLSFFGTGVALYGTSNCSSYDVVFDGGLVRNATLVQGVFFSISNKEPRLHNISLTVKPDGADQIFSFNKAIVTSVANTTVTNPAYFTIDNQNTSVITYTGDWTPAKSVSNIPSAASPAPFHSTSAAGASALLNFTGRAVAVYGSSTTSHGLYTVTLDGTKQTFNGSSEWLLGNMLMFYQDGLDGITYHSLNLTNYGDGTLSLNSVQITQFDTASASTDADVRHGASKVGAIVGPVIALVVVATVLGLYFWSKRRSMHKLHKLDQQPPSIFLPMSFRRKDIGRNDFSAFAESRGSVASTIAEADRSQRNRDEKPLAFTILPDLLANVGKDGHFVAADRHSPRPLPATHLLTERNEPSMNAPQSPNDSQAFSYPPHCSPPVPQNSPPVRSDNPSLIERIAELVAQRINLPRTSRSSVTASSINNMRLHIPTNNV